MITFHRAAVFLRKFLILAGLAAVILWICYAGSVLLGEGFGTFNLQGELIGADHLAFYTAARLIREGQADKVYDHYYVAQYQQELFPPGRWQSLEAFRNPPFYALLYYPMASWPYTVSLWFWSAVSLTALAVGVRLLLAATPPAKPGREEMNYPRTLFWVASFYPTFCAVSYGQNSLLSFLVFAVTYRLLAANRPFAAGLVAGLLWFKPTLLLGLGIWGLLDIRRKWPCAVGVVLTGGIIVLGTYPIIPAAWQSFISTLGGNVVFSSFQQWKMHNPLAFWRLLLPGFEQFYAPLAAACSLAVISLFVRLWKQRRDDLPVMFGGAVFVTLLASPHSLIYEWALLGITAILWWPQTRYNPERWFILYVVVWVVMFVSTEFSKWQLMILSAAVQVSVPVLGWALWHAVLLLNRPSDEIHNHTAHIKNEESLIVLGPADPGSPP